MGDIKYAEYDAERDRAELLKLLEDEPLYLDRYLARERQGVDIVWTARVNGELAGFISYAGLYTFLKFTGYVAKKYRRMGIGSQLWGFADEFYRENNHTVRAECDTTSEAEEFFIKQGFHKFCRLNEMERIGGVLPVADVNIRHYRTEDYHEYRRMVSDAFWFMRESVGLRPNYYDGPTANEHDYYERNHDNIFVLTDEIGLAAAAKISGNELSLLAVRHDAQGRGYGRAMASYTVNTILSRGADKVTLTYIDSNPAGFLYKKLGFKTVFYYDQYVKYFRPETREIPDYLKSINI